MKREKYVFVLLSLFLVSSSCKKGFLDVENTTNLFRQSYVKDLLTMEQFKNGIYILLNGSYEEGISAAYPEIVGDNLKPFTGNPALLAHYAWSQQASDQQENTVGSSSTSMNGIWITTYGVIRACSFVIENSDKYRNENPVKADNIKGEALAMRAMAHFKLINIFAQAYKFTPDASHSGIPYVTTSDVTKPFSRQSVGEVYTKIIEDFTTAIQLLSSSVSDTRYMNIAAAKGLLSRVYLYKEDYANAKALALEVSTQFPLLTISNGYPNDLFKNNEPLESEVLFRYTPINLDYGYSYFLGNYLSSTYLQFTATNDIVSLLLENSNDIRSSWVTDVAGDWIVVKFPMDVTPELSPAPATIETAYYSPALRSSELFLTVSEASAKTGDENTARTYLDAIRKRADPSIASITASGTALLDSIYKERRKELAFEGLRMYDLQRWKLGVHRIDVIAGTSKDLPYPSDRAISPIPLLDVRQERLEQNPSY